MRDHFQTEPQKIKGIGEFFEHEGINLMTSFGVGSGKINFVVSVQILESILLSLNRDIIIDKIPQVPLDRELALIRAILIMTHLNADNIIFLGHTNPKLPRVLLEDTRWS